MAKLAQRYFTSHGPATVHDFSWWSGLSLTECKKALALVANCFFSETIDGYTYYFSNAHISMPIEGYTHLLPAFDEYVISYKNRSAVISQEHQFRAFSNNGIFRPLIVANGKVTGIWKQTIKKEKLILETEFFHANSTLVDHTIEDAANPLGAFLKKQVEVIR